MSVSLAPAPPSSVAYVRWSMSGPAAFALIAGMAVFAAVQWLPAVLNDPDTLWHIRTGEWILANRTVPTVDTFSYTAQGRAWVAHEWLSEVVLALAYRTAGWNGLLILTAAAAGSSVAAVAFYVRQQTRVDVAVVLVLLMIACGGPTLLARPHLVALPFMTLWAIALVIARARGVAPSWLLLPVMTVWANLHGGFLVGLVLASALAVEAAFDPACRRGDQLRRWGIFVAGAVLAAVVTPQGVDTLIFPLRLLAMKNLYQIQEWKPSDLGHLSGVTVAILLALYLGLTGKLLLPRFRVFLLAGLVFTTMQHMRNAQLFGVMGPLLIAGALGPRQPILTPERILSLLMAIVAVVSLGLRVGLPLEQRVDGGAYASAALASVPQELREKPVLNEYGFGGLLIFSGVRPFIDGRADLYGDDVLEIYMSIINAEGNVLDEVLRRYGIGWTMFAADTVVPALMDRTAGWHRLYSDKVAVIHVRDSVVENGSIPGRAGN